MFRRSALLALILLVVLAWAAVPALAEEGGIHWLSYDAALAARKKQAKPVLIYFHLPYCYRCKEMKRKVYSQAAVIDKLNSEFIAAKVDMEKDPAPGKLYGIDYTPSYLFLSAAGKEVYRDKGVIGLERFEALLDYVQRGAYKRFTLDQFIKRR